MGNGGDVAREASEDVDLGGAADDVAEDDVAGGEAVVVVFVVGGWELDAGGVAVGIHWVSLVWRSWLLSKWVGRFVVREEGDELGLGGEEEGGG